MEHRCAPLRSASVFKLANVLMQASLSSSMKKDVLQTYFHHLKCLFDKDQQSVDYDS